MLKTLSPQESTAIAIAERRYAKINFKDDPMPDDPFLHVSLSGTSGNGEIIDVGCGLGRVVPLLPKLGIRNYFGVDPSAVSVEFCRKTWPWLRFEVGDMRQLGAQYPGRFDGFLLLSVLMFIPKRDLDQVLLSLRACLKRGASGIIILNLGRQGRHMVRGADGMKFTLLTFEEITDGLRRNKFEVCRHVIRKISPIDEELRMHVKAA